MYTPRPDLALHAAVGPWCALAGQLLGLALHALVPQVPRHDAVAAAAGCLAVALLREAWGLYRHGKWDNSDILATLLGGAPVVAAGAIGHILSG